MTKVVKFADYKKSHDFLEEFVERLINQSLKESKEESAITKIANQLQKDIKFNYSLIFTFGAGINAMYPIVMHLLKNSNLNVELTVENVVLLTITAIAIAYLEEKKNKTGELSIVCDICNSKGSIQTDSGEETCQKCSGKGSTKSLVTRNDTDTLLAELKLRGIGNGIVKKLVTCFVSVGGFLKMIFKHASLIISNFVDLFAYTSLLIPTMNAISGIINASSLTLETLPMDIAKNLLVFGVGVGTMLAKRGYEWISKKITDFLRSKNIIRGNEPTELRGIESQIKKDVIINDNMSK
jgi:hypothetical protein